MSEPDSRLDPEVRSMVNQIRPLDLSLAEAIDQVTSLAAVSRAVEVWAARKKVEPWLFKAAAVGARWQCGESFDPCLVTEAEFDAAISFAANPYDTHNPKG